MYSINIVAYYVDLVLTWLTYYATFIYANFREFAWVVKCAAISLTLSIALIIVCLVRVFFVWLKRRRWSRVEHKLEKRFSEPIHYILSVDAKPNMSRNEVMEALNLSNSDLNSRTLLKNYREKLAFARLVYKARIAENAVLGRKGNLHVLLEIFRVQDFLEEIVNRDKLNMKVEALHMLRAFKVPINPWISNQLMNAKRVRVRRLTMYAAVMSNSNADLDYFESQFFDENCCIYDEIQLGYALSRRRSSKRKIPNLAHWAYMQKNPGTQCIFVRLMRMFEQRDYCSELEEFFQHNSDKQLIEEISRTWGYLHYEEGENLLAEMLLTQPDETKVAIMHAITRIGTGRHLGALVDGYTNSGDPSVRLEALRCIYNYGDEGREKFEELETKAQTDVEKSFFEFFHNPITLKTIPLSDHDAYRPLFGNNLYGVD
ncbi:MAG: hypothetical protein J1F05_07510 [Muribaculaceae bacterium]|nr:hypothetical protein [Muribaculaceae bacterium]